MTGKFDWSQRYPKCKGCRFFGKDIPCNYFFDTGKTPQSQGVKLNWRGDGGCELREDGDRKPNSKPITFSKKSAMNRQTFSKTDSVETRNLYEQGLSDAEIAEEIGVHPKTVANWRRRNNLEQNKKNCRVKLNEAEAMRLYKEGLSDRAIAEKMGLYHQTVNNWRLKNRLPSNFRNGRKAACDG